MLQITPENVFVFYSFEWILSGLLAVILLWALYRHPPLRKENPLLFLLAASVSLAVAFFLTSFLNFYEFYYQHRLFPQAPENVAFPFFVLSALLLGSSRSSSTHFRHLWLSALASFACVGLLILLMRWVTGSMEPGALHWLALALFLFFLLVENWNGAVSGRWFLAVTFLGFSLGFLFLFFLHYRLPNEWRLIWWSGHHLALLGSLVALAHIIESWTQDLFIKFFIRLNLTFMVLAGFIIVVVTGVQRREYVASAQREAADLMEFLQGHVMYFHDQGQEDGQVLNHPEMTRRIVSDFGNLHALRSVSICFNDLELTLAIDGQGMIERSIRPVSPRAVPGTFEPVLEGSFLRIFAPIYSEARVAGWVELAESVVPMNQRIAHQIMTIFSAFTVMVMVGSVLIGIIVSQADRTIRRQYDELKRTHQQLLQAAKLAALGEMAAGVAHEINNPLGVISGHAEYLGKLAQLRQDPDLLEDLRIIQRNASRAARIIRELLDFARPHRLNRQETDINRILNESLNLLAPRLSGGELRVQKTLMPLPPVPVDRDRLQQVFVNLLNNCVDACGDGGTIQLTTRYDPLRCQVEISVRDDGIGISGENLKKIFDPFFTTKKGGTGLGLSVSYRIVRDHGGEILVDSQEGQGAVFVVTLPVGQEHKGANLKES